MTGTRQITEHCIRIGCPALTRPLIGLHDRLSANGHFPKQGCGNTLLTALSAIEQSNDKKTIIDRLATDISQDPVFAMLVISWVDDRVTTLPIFWHPLDQSLNHFININQARFVVGYQTTEARESPVILNARITAELNLALLRQAA